VKIKGIYLNVLHQRSSGETRIKVVVVNYIFHEKQDRGKEKRIKRKGKKEKKT
jgi:hypothetical protein